MPESEGFDPAALEMLRRVGKDVLVARMVGMFVANAPTRLGAMRASLDSGDLDGLVHAAHSLKSSAGQLGAIRLQHLLASIETDARAGTDLGRIRPAVDDARAEVERAISWFTSQMDGQ